MLPPLESWSSKECNQIIFSSIWKRRLKVNSAHWSKFERISINKIYISSLPYFAWNAKKKQIEIELTFFVKKSFYDIFTVNIRPSLNDFRLSSAWFYLGRIYYIKNKVFTKHFGGRMTPNFKGRRVIFQYYILSASIKKFINK